MTKAAISLGGSVIQVLRPGPNEIVAASGVDASAATIPSKVAVVRIVATAFAGTNPTLHMSINTVATTSSMILIQDTVEYFKVIEDDVLHFIMGGTTPTANVNVTLIGGGGVGVLSFMLKADGSSKMLKADGSSFMLKT